MTVITQNDQSFFLTAQAILIQDDRDVASNWASEHIVTNPALKWVLGKYVEADNANSNGQYWTLGDLRMKQPTLQHGPMNMGHQANRIVGTFVASELIYPTGGPDESAGAVNPYIEALGAYWKYYFPEDLADVEAAYSDGSLFLSMECVAESVTCVGDNSCGETFPYTGPNSAEYCDHIRNRTSAKQLNNPHFLGGALVIPPDRPGWKNASVNEISRYIDKNATEAERIYNEISQEASHLSPQEWEQTMRALMIEQYLGELNERAKAMRKKRVLANGRRIGESLARRYKWQS